MQLTPALLLGACAVVDSKAYRPQIDPTASKVLHGRFSCTPSYVSHAVGFDGPPSLAAIIGGVECDTVLLEAADGPAWTVSLERYGITSVPRRIDAGQGLALNDAGPFSLPTRSNCGSGASECRDARVLVFVDTEGDLVTVQDRGGGGVLTLLPEGLVGRRFAIFPRIRP
jgi:hypothetical protein